LFTLIVYNILLLIFSPFVALYLFWRLVIIGKSRDGILERLGFVPARKCAGSEPRIWLHAVSVGESVAARPVWEEMLEVLPGWRLYHSTMTDTAQVQAAKAVGTRGEMLYFPFDFFPCVWLALSRVRPSLIVLVETEMWPNFLAVAHLLGIKVMMVNGRISDRSLRGSTHLGPLYRWMTTNIDRYCMQSPGDAERIIAIGAAPDRVTVTGNTKFDQIMAPVSLGEQVKLRGKLGLTRDEPLLLAGSTHEGEEDIVLRAFRQVKTADPRVRLIIAPRNINRAQEVEDLVSAHGFPVARRTRMATIPPPPDAVIILDTIGELARAYALCTVAFVGGSLIPIGGHNVLEPLAMGKPVVFGPCMSNFRDIAVIVNEAGIGMTIHDAAELAARWLELLNDPQRRRTIADTAAVIFTEHRGASTRSAHAAALLVGSPVQEL